MFILVLFHTFAAQLHERYGIIIDSLLTHNGPVIDSLLTHNGPVTDS